jgi:hypothetical protein
MAHFQSSDEFPGYDPAPNVATPAEIRQAEELRHRLEEQYLSEGSTNEAPKPANSGNVH